MNLQVEVPLETEKDGRRGKSDASDQECVCEGRKSGVEEGRHRTENSEPSAGLHVKVQKGQKAESKADRSLKMEPPDGGWGWVVVFASVVIMVCIHCISLSSVIFFSRYLLLSGVSSTTTASIFNIFSFNYTVTGLFARPLSQEFGKRKIGVAGAFLACLGFTITAFTPAPEFLFFSISVLCGVGGGIVTPLCITLVPSYFTRRRGVATAILNCGVGVAQIFIPPFATFLQETFADRGATLIFSGLMLQSCLAATTFHPVERHMKPASAKSTEQGQQETNPRPAPQTITSTSTLNPRMLVRVAKSVKSDLGILRSPRACIITVARSLAACSNVNFLMMVPFALHASGSSLEFAAWCLSSLSVTGFIFRILTAALNDLPFFKIRVIYVTGFVIMAVTTAAFPLVTSQVYRIALLLVYGVGMGTTSGLFTLIIIDVMGLDRLAPLYGTTSFMQGLVFVTFGPLFGVIRDTSGSYSVSIWSAAGLMGCCVILWALMGRATRWDDARREEERPNL